MIPGAVGVGMKKLDSAFGRPACMIATANIISYRDGFANRSTSLRLDLIFFACIRNVYLRIF